MDQKTLHDVGNYLHQIISYCEYLAESNDCSQAADYAARIKKNAYAIDTLVSDYAVSKDDVLISKEMLETIDFERYAGVKILIVDDIAENIEIMRKIFKVFSCEIVSANGGEEALEVYKNGFEPEIVCIDVVMPGMDGVQATAALKELGSKAFFVAVSALKNQLRNVSSVFDCWLPKPFTLEQIVETLLEFESKKNSQIASESPVFALELDEETKKQLLEHAKNGAYTSLTTLVQTIQDSPSKAFLLRSLRQMDLNAIVKSIVSP